MMHTTSPGGDHPDAGRFKGASITRPWTAGRAASSLPSTGMTMPLGNALSYPVEKALFVHQQIDPDRYERIAKIPNVIGARITRACYGQVRKLNSLDLGNS
jgi:hypothetical protein